MPPYDQLTEIIRGTRQNRIIWEQGPSADELQAWKASDRQRLAQPYAILRQVANTDIGMRYELTHRSQRFDSNIVQEFGKYLFAEDLLRH